MHFSERLGYSKPKLALSEDQISDPLRAKCWNCIYKIYFSDIYGRSAGYGGASYSGSFSEITDRLRYAFFEISYDKKPGPDREREIIREWFFNSKFPKFYDFIEFLSSAESRASDEYSIEYRRRRAYEKWINEILEGEKAVFRFVDHKLTKIVEAHEIHEVECATNFDTPFSNHISAALLLYSKRPDPDFRNAIKESISAVEAAAKMYCGDKSADLERALAKLDEQIGLHKQVLAAFKNLYRWTSAADGIRHGMMDEPNLTEHETRFMIIACSAFCNLLAAQSKR